MILDGHVDDIWWIFLIGFDDRFIIVINQSIKNNFSILIDASDLTHQSWIFHIKI